MIRWQAEITYLTDAGPVLIEGPQSATRRTAKPRWHPADAMHFAERAMRGPQPMAHAGRTTCGADCWGVPGVGVEMCGTEAQMWLRACQKHRNMLDSLAAAFPRDGGPIWC